MAIISLKAIYNSRNYNGVLNFLLFLLCVAIYNSRNYNGVLNNE